MSVIPSQPYSGTINRPSSARPNIGPLHLILLVTFAVSVTIWGATLVGGASGYELPRFISLAGFFGVACAFFVVSRLSSAGYQSLFEIPVFMTAVALVEFGAAPLACFLDPNALAPQLRGDISLFYPALLIVIAGIVALWLGVGLARSRKQATAVPDPRALRDSDSRGMILFYGSALYLAGVAAKVYMLRSGMYFLLASPDVVSAHLAQQQVLFVISTFGFCALVFFSVEACFHPGDKIRVALFWAVLVSECFFGLISGYKAMVLINLAAVAVVSSLAGRKLRIRWFAFAVLGLIAIYPLVNQYRSTALGRGGDIGASAATEAVRGAAAQTAGQQGTVGGWVQSGWLSSVSRVNMLQGIALLLAYQDRAYMLEGDERLWMIPFYPFVPRFLWTSKPIDDIGIRFTEMTTGLGSSCTSPTIPGDLYIRHHGIAGVLLGMFLVGLAIQWLTNPVRLRPSKRNLFIYACVFLAAANWEYDFFGYACSVIRIYALAQILALVLYGHARAPTRSRVRTGNRK